MDVICACPLASQVPHEIAFLRERRLARLEGVVHSALLPACLLGAVAVYQYPVMQHLRQPKYVVIIQVTFSEQA